MRLTLPPGARCSDENKYRVNLLIKLLLGASVVAVTLAIIYERHHEFSCVGGAAPVTAHVPLLGVRPCMV